MKISIVGFRTTFFLFSRRCGRKDPIPPPFGISECNVSPYGNNLPSCSCPVKCFFHPAQRMCGLHNYFTVRLCKIPSGFTERSEHTGVSSAPGDETFRRIRKKTSLYPLFREVVLQNTNRRLQIQNPKFGNFLQVSRADFIQKIQIRFRTGSFY